MCDATSCQACIDQTNVGDGNFEKCEWHSVDNYCLNWYDDPNNPDAVGNCWATTTVVVISVIVGICCICGILYFVFCRNRSRTPIGESAKPTQVTSVTPAVATTQQVPMQHTVQMPVMQGMQGVPINVNGQQMVMFPAGTQIPMQQVPVQYVVAESQGAPPQYQQVPPSPSSPYESEGAVSDNANAETGHFVYN